MGETFVPTPAAPVAEERKPPYREIGQLVDVLVLPQKPGGRKGYGDKDGKRELGVLLAREERRNQRHTEDATFPCGCAWNGERYVMLEPYVDAGPTVVARPPSDSCVACRGTGKIRDKHHYLVIRRSVDAEAEGAKRHGYYSPDDEADQFFKGEGPRGWKIETPGKREKRQVVSLEHVAEHSHVTRQSLNNYRAEGQKLLQGLPKGGRSEDVNAVQLDRIEAKLDVVLERLPAEPAKPEANEADRRKHLRLIADDGSEAA
jgi:hypothetical protein